MANRIALLKQEEMKTWRKIDETKKKTNEILLLKSKNFERVHQVSYKSFMIICFSNKITCSRIKTILKVLKFKTMSLYEIKQIKGKRLSKIYTYKSTLRLRSLRNKLKLMKRKRKSF